MGEARRIGMLRRKRAVGINAKGRGGARGARSYSGIHARSRLSRRLL